MYLVLWQDLVKKWVTCTATHESVGTDLEDYRSCALQSPLLILKLLVLQEQTRVSLYASVQYLLRTLSTTEHSTATP